MNVSFSPEEANATVASLRLRAVILQTHQFGFTSLPFTSSWLEHEVALLTQVADKIEFSATQEWLDRRAAYDAMQGADIPESELRALAGDR